MQKNAQILTILPVYMALSYISFSVNCTTVAALNRKALVLPGLDRIPRKIDALICVLVPKYTLYVPFNSVLLGSVPRSVAFFSAHSTHRSTMEKFLLTSPCILLPLHSTCLSNVPNFSGVLQSPFFSLFSLRSRFLLLGFLLFLLFFLYVSSIVR